MKIVKFVNRVRVVSYKAVPLDLRGGRVVQWCWVNFQCRGVLLIWIRVGQGPTALAVGVGGVVWTFFLSSIFSLFFLPDSLGDGLIQTEILSQRAVKSKTTNQILWISPLNLPYLFGYKTGFVPPWKDYK